MEYSNGEFNNDHSDETSRFASTTTSLTQSNTNAPKARPHKKQQVNAFVRGARHIYHPLGFKKGYNFTLWFIFAGAMAGFCLARFQYLDFENVMCGPGFNAINRAMPGDCYWYRETTVSKVGIMMHLATILPAGVLVWAQFVLVIRYRWMILHRINGYLLILLSFAATAGAIMVARHAFGGNLTTQTAAGTIGIIFITSLVLAWINIKRLQIEQHRAWMLRAWFYAASIISMRPLSMIAAQVISAIGGYYGSMPCNVVASITSPENFPYLFPACVPYLTGENHEAWTVVVATMRNPTSPASPAAVLHQAYGMTTWFALALHAVGVEIYLRLTPGETQRLREVSRQRQLEAGMRHPGNAGLTRARLGDTGPKLEVRYDEVGQQEA